MDRSLYLSRIPVQGRGCTADEPPPATVQPHCTHGGFAGKDLATRSYAEILEKGGYEFDMFGDSMLILAAQARSWCASVTGRFATQHYMVGVRRAVVSDRPLVLLTAW